MRTSTLNDLRSRGFSSEHCPVTRTVMPNMTRTFEGFHVSYCSDPCDYGCDTTALVLQGRVFFVLNGYHADALVDAAVQNGIDGCIAVFVQRIDQANRLSEHRMAAELVADPFSLYPTTRELIGQHGVDLIVRAVTGAS